MNNKTANSIKELLSDEFFIRWVFSPDEDSNHYWKEVMNRDAQARDRINKARAILVHMQYDKKYSLNENEYSDMLDTLVKEYRFSNYNHNTDRNRFSWKAIAASLALLVAIGFSLFFLQLNIYELEEPIVKPSTEVKKTDKGEKLTIKLTDGTMVKLNASSDLSYAKGFDKDVRKVILDGEAYFEVERDTARPFIIQSGDIQTTVLGTKFNVRSYPNEERIEVAVVEGKVKVGYDEHNYTFLTQNEVSIYQKKEKQLAKKSGDVSKIIAWHKNILVFDDATPDEVWKRLENWYGVNIIIENQQNIKGRYSGIYKNEPLETVLKGISFASGFKFEINEDKNVIIK